MGEPQIGWARVLFDGVEVWRGNTSAIWSKPGRHGGYIEISGLSPGMHTMRAESLGFDYRPCAANIAANIDASWRARRLRAFARVAD